MAHMGACLIHPLLIRRGRIVPIVDHADLLTICARYGHHLLCEVGDGVGILGRLRPWER